MGIRRSRIFNGMRESFFSILVLMMVFILVILMYLRSVDIRKEQGIRAKFLRKL